MRIQHFLPKGQRRGSLLVDVLLSVAIFGTIVAAFSAGIAGSERGTRASSERTRALYIAMEGLEIVRSIRDESSGYNTLDAQVGATRYLVPDDTGWAFTSAVPPKIDDLFQRTVTVEDTFDEFAVENINEKKVTTTVSWAETFGPSKSISMSTYVTNWHGTAAAACPDWGAATVVGDLAQGTESFTSVVYNNGLLYALSQDSGLSFAGIGIYDVSGPNPVYQTPDISFPGILSFFGMYDLALEENGNYLYVARNNNTNELATLDIQTPGDYTLASETDLPGNGAARGLYVENGNLHVVRQQETGEASGDEEYVQLDIGTDASSPAITKEVDVETPAAVQLNAVTVDGGYAYIAGSNVNDSSKDLVVIETGAPSEVGAGDPNQTDGNYSYAIGTHNGYVYMGVDGNYTNELYSFSKNSDPGASVSSYSTGNDGSVYDMYIYEPAGCTPVAILATDSDSGTEKYYLQIVDITNGSDISVGNARLLSLDLESTLVGMGLSGSPKPIARGITVRESDNTIFLVGGTDSLGGGKGFIIAIQPG